MFRKLATLGAVLAGLCLGVPGAQALGFDVLLSGLDSPRKLTFGPDGQLYFTEAGVGGAGPCLEIFGAPYCYGETSAVSRWSNGVVETLVSDLPSIGNNGIDVSGATDIAFDSLGNALVLMGNTGQAPTDLFPGAPEADQPVFGTVLRLDALTPGTGWTVISDPYSFELANNPDGGELDSNPFALTRGGNQIFIADAAANALLSAAEDGANLATQAVFPEQLVQNPFAPPGVLVPMQAVPTAVEVGPDGALYVGQLTGFPFPVGGASVFRVDPTDGSISVFASGFTNIIDLVFDPFNNLYVLENAANSLLSGDPSGALIRIRPNGARKPLLTGAEGLISPTGVALGPDNYLYLANQGDGAGQGQLIRLNQPVAVPEPLTLLGATAALAFGAAVKRRLSS
ncbi:MAG: ScyD/ScyE family protein [Cyanobacteriota bacterium]|jgi:hypothetical protein